MERIHCCCKLTQIDHDFTFFPISFLLYLLFTIGLCVILIIVEILEFYDSANHSVRKLLIGSYTTHGLNQLHQISWANTQSYDDYITIRILDYVLIYGIMILSVWESSFSFFRFYTTVYCSINFYSIPTNKVLIKFVLYYGIAFCLLCMFQIHVYYGIFPVIIIMHIGFNFYCNIRFSNTLTEQYRKFIGMHAIFRHFGKKYCPK